MRPQAIVVVLFLAVAAIFTTLNPETVLESRSVRWPWGAHALPLVAIVLVVSAATLGLLLIIDAIGVSIRTRALHRLEEQLAVREREIAEMKSRAYDTVSRKIDELREQLSGEIEAVGKLVRERSSTSAPTRPEA